MTEGSRRPASMRWMAGLAVATLLWFSPVLFGGKVFITDNYLGAFFHPLQLWSDLLDSGFPLYADLNFGNAYPVRILFAAAAGLVGRAAAYDLFVWAAFAIAAIGTYLYVLELTSDAAAGAVSGAAFAFSTFMQAHVGHETMTHSAAWLPLILWSTHRIVAWQAWRDAGLLALEAAAMYLANHPEIYLQVALVAGAYALTLLWSASRRGRAALLLASAWALSVLLVAWQLVGAAEYASFANRVATARTLTLHGALPLSQLAQVALPFVFGNGIPTVMAPLSNFGYEMFVEVASYVAPPVLMLAFAGAACRWRSQPVRFWSVAATLLLVLALGPQTLLGEALFFAPVFRLFNIPGRYVLTFHFAMSVLCGIGVASLLARETGIARRLAWGILPTIAAIASYPLVVEKAKSAGVSLPAFWMNPSVVIPAVIALASLAALWVATRDIGRYASVLLMAASVIAGCGYFGWNAPWLSASGPAGYAIDPAPVVKAFKEEVDSAAGRVIAADGWLGPLGIGPNQNMLFNLRSVSGYGPLISKNYVDFTSLTNAGWINPAAFNPENASLDLLAAKWVFPYGTASIGQSEIRNGVPISAPALARVIGGTCAGSPLPSSVGFRLPKPGAVRELVLVTSLGCGLEVPQGTVVAHAILQGPDGRGSLRIPIVAGIDTAEWTADCPLPNATARHSVPAFFDSTPLPQVAPGCKGHTYFARLPARDWNADSLRVEWAASLESFPKAMLNLQHVSIVGANPGATYALGLADAIFADQARWRVHRLSEGHEVYENLRARPWAWLARVSVRASSTAEAIAMVRTGNLQDGRRFDPSRVAVSTERTALPADPTMSGEDGMAKIERWDSGDIEVATESRHPAMLVLSQRNYPGWKAEVDGVPAKILPVDGVIQGVELPAGSHRVALSFAPAHLLWLSLVAVLALLGSFALVVFGKPAYSRPMTYAS